MNDFAANEAALCRNSAATEAGEAGAPPGLRVNRRTFLAGLGCGGAAFLLSPLHVPIALKRGAEDLLFCIGSFGAGDGGTLHTLRVCDGKPSVLHSTSSARPAAIARHPFRSILYVANDVSHYRYQPRGGVETFAVDQATGTIELVGRQALSLSATRPRSLAVSPDGRSLLVAAFGGGSYNALPIDASGVPGAPTAILKQVGRGKHPTEQASAHPSHVLFHADTGLAIAADYGADRLDILTPGGGSGAGPLQVASRVPCAAGSGPSEIAIHRNGRLLVVRHVLCPALAAFRITHESALIPVAETRLSSVAAAICFHPERDVLYCTRVQDTCAASLTAFSIDPQKGTLQPIREVTLPAGVGTAIYFAGSTLWLASDQGLIAAELDFGTGEPREVARAATIPNIRSLAVLRQA